MSTIDNSFGVPATVLAEWSRELARIELPTTGASFAHVQCRNPALWMARFVLTELHGINSSTSLRQGVPSRIITYVLPDAVSVAVAERFIRPSIMGEADPGMRIVTYSGLTEALTSSPFPEYLRSAIIVLDTDFGRVPTQLVAASTELLRVWVQVAARKETFSGAVVAISPSPASLWPSDYINKTFGRPIVDLVLGHDPKPVVKAFWGYGYGIVDDIVRAISSVPLDTNTRSTIVCHIPLEQGLEVEERLAKKNPFPVPCGACVVPRARPLAWQAQPENYRGVSVLLVEPYRRFMPPIDWAYYHILPQGLQSLVVDTGLPQVVELESDGRQDEARALYAGSLGEPRRREAPHVTVVRDIFYPNDPLVIDPSSATGWPAWQDGMPETLMRLVAQLNDAHRTLSALPANFPMESPWAAEVLRRLRMMQLIKPRNPLSLVGRALKERLVLASPEAGVATSFLKTGFARSLPEALLLAGIGRAPSPAAKAWLICAAAACHVGISNILAGIRAPRWAIRPAMDAHPAADLLAKGPLWLAVTTVRWDTKDDNADMGLSFAAFRERVSKVSERVAPGLDPDTAVDDVSSDDLLAVETTVVRAWIQNLAGITDGPGPIGRAREALTGQDVRVQDDRRHGGLHSTPDCSFGVHFGLSRTEHGYTTDTFTLVSNEAVVRVLEDLFPTPPGSEIPDYMVLLRTCHQA